MVRKLNKLFSVILSNFNKSGGNICLIKVIFTRNAIKLYKKLTGIQNKRTLFEGLRHYASSAVGYASFLYEKTDFKYQQFVYKPLRLRISRIVYADDSFCQSVRRS